MNSSTSGCAHCGLPLGRRPLQHPLTGEARQFCCYGCVLAWQIGRGMVAAGEAVGLLIRFGIGAFLTINIMLFSLLLYSSAIEDVAVQRSAVHWLLLALATPAMVVLGAPFAAQAARAAAAGQASADTLILLGAGAAYGYSAWATVTGQPHVYFDTATMVLVLSTFGRYLEACGRADAMRSLEPLLAPERLPARLHDEDGERMVTADQVPVGARVSVRPGERVAVDGIVLVGTSEVDEMLLTGEARPVTRIAGHHVLAGSINGSGPLLVRAEHAAAESRWAKLCRVVMRALQTQGPLQQFADRTAAAFVPIVLLLAAAVTLYWSGLRPPGEAMLIGLAVLVAACPCALGLAAPLANSIACARALAGGVLVRGGAALERLASVRVLAFDKTGTLTEGNLSLRGCEPLGGASADVALTIAAALEQRAEHPVARALQAYVRELRARLPAVDDLHTTPGAGISGQLGGMPVACGTAAHLRAGGFSVPSIGVQLASALAAEGATVSFVGWKGRARGLLVFTDVLRAEAAPTIARLRSDRLHPVVVSGDMLAAVQTFAGALGIDEAHAECTPEGKLALIRLLRMRHGAVAAVGDRLNDAPALAAADVGIATGATDLACEAADVVLSRDGLARLPDLFALARASRRVVIGNLAWAVGYNAVALGFAAGGMLQPVLAAALMAVSSLLVIANSRRLERFPFGAASADVSCDEVPASESPAAAGAAPPAAVDVADTHSTRH